MQSDLVAQGGGICACRVILLEFACADDASLHAVAVFVMQKCPEQLQQAERVGHACCTFEYAAVLDCVLTPTTDNVASDCMVLASNRFDTT